MGRKKIDAGSKPAVEELGLDVLIPRYALNKSECDAYKKLCDEDNTRIKTLMQEQGVTKKEVAGYIATCVIQERKSMNEEMLLEVAHKVGLQDIIKTKEYIDYDALEKAIYHGEIPKEVLMQIDKCQKTQEVATLRITRAKEG